MSFIAVTDDDAGTRKLVSQAMKKDGYNVIAADNGAEGLALILRYRPDLDVSIVQMPEIAGFEVLSKSAPTLSCAPHRLFC